jgi:hypothetical protein
MDFNINDRVRVKKYDELPELMKNKGIGRLCGKDGEIVDKLWSGARGCYLYKIRFDGYSSDSSVDFVGKAIDLISEIDKKQYAYEFDYLDKVVVARLYEVGEDYKTEIAKAHGHIIHEGVVGISQAASYALKNINKKLSENLN